MILTTILWMLIAVTFFGNRLIGIIFVIVWLFRIYRAQIPKLFLRSITLMIIPVSIFLLYQKQMDNQIQIIKNNVGPVSFKAEVQPDDLSFRDGNFHGEIFIPSLKQKVSVFGYLPGKEKFSEIQHIQKKSYFKIEGELNLIEPPSNFNQFDSRKFFSAKGIVGEIRAKNLVYQSPTQHFTIRDQLHAIRASLIRATDKFPKHLRMYILGLIFGDKTADFKDELNGVTKLGLIHLFTISGMHVYFLINMVTWILTVLRVQKDQIEDGIVVFLPAYFVIAGSGSSLLRAILISIERITFHKLNVHFSSLDIWSLALMINLLICPLVIFQFGCQLSYLLSLGLILCRKTNILKRTMLLNLISIPVILFNMFEWHVLSLIANMLVVPFFSVVIFPLVIIGYLMAILKSTFFTEFIDHLLLCFDSLINNIANLLGNIVFGKPTTIAVVLMVILALCLIERETKKCYLSFSDTFLQG